MDLTEVNVWIYATAVIARERHETKNGYRFEVTKWKIRLNKNINKYRKEFVFSRFFECLMYPGRM